MRRFGDCGRTRRWTLDVPPPPPAVFGRGEGIPPAVFGRVTGVVFISVIPIVLIHGVTTCGLGGRCCGVVPAMVSRGVRAVGCGRAVVRTVIDDGRFLSTIGAVAAPDVVFIKSCGETKRS